MILKQSNVQVEKTREKIVMMRLVNVDCCVLIVDHSDGWEACLLERLKRS